MRIRLYRLILNGHGTAGPETNVFFFCFFLNFIKCYRMATRILGYVLAAG